MLQKETIRNIFISFSLFTTNLLGLEFSKVTQENYNLIYASGKIYRGDLNRFKRVYYSLPSYKHTIVILNSNGGEMQAGIKLGKFFYDHKISTAVRKNSMCVSSCALAFLGGRDFSGRKSMILPKNTKIGFHNFYYKSGSYVDASKVQRDLASVVDYFSYVQAPNKLMRKMLKTKSDDMFWISNRRHKSYLKTKKGLKIQQTHNKVYAKNSSKNFATSKRLAIQNYFKRINQTIAVANQSRKRQHIALNSLYQDWLGNNLSYVYAKKIKLLKHNKARVLVAYLLKNGKRIYSYNTYTLKRTQYGWRVVAKKNHILKRYARVSKKFASKLP